MKPAETADNDVEDIVEIPDDEADIAVKNFLKASGIKVPEVKRTQGNTVTPILMEHRQVQKPFTLVQNPAGGAEGYHIIDLDPPSTSTQQNEVVISQTIFGGRMPFHLLMPQNIANFMAMPQNIPGMSQNIVNFMAILHNAAGMSQNVIMS